MPKLNYKLTQIRCAFWKWMPSQNLFAVDFGETEETREETIEWMWRHFVDVLQGIEKKP